MYSGRNAYGDPTFNAPGNMKARVEYTRKDIINQIGEAVISEVRLFTDILIPPESLITINNVDWTVISCSAMTMLDGTIDHYEARL